MLKKEGFPGALVVAENHTGVDREYFPADNLNFDATGDAQPGHYHLVAKSQAQLAVAEREKAYQADRQAHQQH